MERIKSIKRKKIASERLYNIAVEGDESYIADGIVVHNCRSVLIPITMFEEWSPDTSVGDKPIEEFIDENKGKGFPVK